MKIKKEIKEVLSGRMALLTKLSIQDEKKFLNSPLNNAIPIRFKNFKECNCFWCKNVRTNFCWNCNKPHCDKHARAIFFPVGIINTFCLECSKELKKLIKQ